MNDTTPIVIEKGIPAPSENERKHQGKYPWRKMEVGDSFLVENKKSSPYAASSYFSKRNPDFKFTTKKLSEGRYRIWRVEA